MEAAHNICRSHGCYKMALSSNLRRKDAHQFYEHLGFKQHGVSYNLFARFFEIYFAGQNTEKKLRERHREPRRVVIY